MDAEEIVEIVEDVERIKPALIVAGVAGALMGLGTGFFIGWRVANAKLQAKYDARLEEEIHEAKAFYARLNKVNMETPEKAVQQLRPELVDAAEALLEYQGTPQDDPEPPTPATIVEVEVNNVFDTKVTDTWDQEAEEELRKANPGKPYIISEGEYAESEGFAQSTLTYYAGDETLADERDQHIPNIDQTVGLENLRRFGHGTGDARTVFIRNERLRLDFEVLLSDGKYAHEVLGLQHSDGYDARRRPVLRMRNE